MKHEEGFFNGVRIYYQCWLPETEPKAVLLVVHGLAEHGGRYMNLVNHFIPLGYAVYAADLLGHGRSEGARVYLERFADYTDTLASFREMIRGWQKGKPVFLVGHSMGGLIGALYLLSHQDELAGAVLSGPAVKPPDDISPFVLFAGKVLSALMPKLGLIQLEAEGVSRDPAVVKAYETDPLVFRGKITARLGAEMIRAMGRIGGRTVWSIRPARRCSMTGSPPSTGSSSSTMAYTMRSSTNRNMAAYCRMSNRGLKRTPFEMKSPLPRIPPPRRSRERG